MMPKNYYLVLEIPADSTQREIKSAYRRLAKEYHPDRCSDSHTPFLGIQEAYSVLGDPVSRQEHDERLREAEKTRILRRNSPPRRRQEFHSSTEIVEPLIPGESPASGAFDPFDPLDRFGKAGNSLQPYFDIEDLLHRLTGGIPGSGRGGRQESPAVEVAITPQQASHGGILRIPVPGLYQCPACGGSGERGFFFACSSCGGTGYNNYDYPLRLEFPPGVPDNYVLRVPLDSFGRHDSWLTIRFKTRS